MDRQTDGQTFTQRDGDWLTGRQAGKQAGRQTGRQGGTEYEMNGLVSSKPCVQGQLLLTGG